ncbi:hypothetical protein DGWBC_0294 [Dehalogenimonas sp. WBC-2]|nr:hypothetical protein DGWBC_0294 [Dehalogenimonas sp. WBC-2]
MPSRENEYYTGKGVPGRGLCPFCGNLNISYNKKFQSWRCNYCEKSFPTPSYGPGGPSSEPTSHPRPATPELKICPKCDNKSLWFNPTTSLYECLNKSCKRRFTETELKSPPSFATKPPIQTSKEKVPTIRWWKINRFFKKLFLLVIRLLLFTIVGAITALVLVGVADVLNVEPLNVTAIIVSAIGIIVVLKTLGEAVRHRLTIIRTFMTLLLTTIYIASAWSYFQLESISDAKERLDRLFTSDNSFREMVDNIIQLSDFKFDFSTSDPASNNTSTTIPPTTSNSTSNSKYVTINGARIIGASGNLIKLQNNPAAKNPSYQQLLDFLRNDPTDTKAYNYNNFVCADFAEMLHNNAEQAGWKAAYVCIELGPSPGYPIGSGHALNAFETADAGLIFIDCTGLLSAGPSSADKIVKVVEGSAYIPNSLFPEYGWNSTWGNMGIILKIETITW